ncbi:ATP-dependent DNA helicase RecG [Thermaerobacter composti]|uniref:ATP-dependent DNA helicase RecG n=1 Tax=Thermaerobacter composti TaxID=554949 RepID=A0ABZ0QT97_9FIRM|nr:ATP-dependent DNA helicase RecG [Thermaerobacter composti]WPD19927.1 ATP-dependent DNA helicase RecG [Thermaerobacter composti]
MDEPRARDPGRASSRPPTRGTPAGRDPRPHGDVGQAAPAGSAPAGAGVRGDLGGEPDGGWRRLIQALQAAGDLPPALPADEAAAGVRRALEAVARTLPPARRGPLREAYRLFHDFAHLAPALRKERVARALALVADAARHLPPARDAGDHRPVPAARAMGGANGGSAPSRLASRDGGGAVAGGDAGAGPAPGRGRVEPWSVTLTTPLGRLPGVGRRQAQRLARLGLSTAGDLLWHLPRRYEDRSVWKPIVRLVPGEVATVQAVVLDAQRVPTRTGRTVVRVTVSDGSGRLDAVFFNQPYRLQQLVPGRTVLLSGRVDAGYRGLQMEHPEVEVLEGATDEPVHTARIVPIYPATEGVNQRWLRQLAWRVVGALADQVDEILPAAVRQELGLVDRATALRHIHFPPDAAAWQAARRRLAFEEWFVMQVALARVRSQQQQEPGRAHRPDGPRVARFLASLPFELTAAQRRVLDEIRADMEAPRPMRRLVQGDVGSGKTVVAAWAMVKAVESGGQAALMAPTEILAEQHARRLQQLLAPVGIPVVSLVGSLPAGDRERVLAGLASGRWPVVVGTHALIQDEVRFHDLSLVIIDEQHRFGVRQRALLQGKGQVPDLLVMTATPIPRTLALTLYGDLDVSVIDQLPPGRRPVRTLWLRGRQRRRAYDLLAARVAAGEQGYVVCPLVDEPADGAGDAEQKAVTTWAEFVARHYPKLRVGILHGRMPGAEKERVMAAFERHALDVLVATTVIEVGVDVPNATVMIVEGADRFGLAQLHQLRGRVGRGTKESLCILVADPATPEGRMRLEALCRTQSGFEIAEFDLQLRGPGDFFGTRQHGLPALRIADPVRDAQLLRQARQVARRLLEQDPDLRQPDHQALRREVMDRYGAFLTQARAMWS